MRYEVPPTWDQLTALEKMQVLGDLYLSAVREAGNDRVQREKVYHAFVTPKSRKEKYIAVKRAMQRDEATR